MGDTNALTNLGTIFTTITGWIADIVDTITASPILLVGLGIFVVGAVEIIDHCPTLKKSGCIGEA